MRLTYAVPVAAFFALSALFAVYLYQIRFEGRDIAQVPSALIDSPVPVFTLPPVEGSARPGFSNADFGGRVTLVNVFASWCVPCRVEHPILMRLAREGIPIYGVSYKDKADDANRFLGNFGNPYSRVGADVTGRVAIEWGVYGVPETFVVDADKRIRYRHVGPIMQRDLHDVIRPLLVQFGR